MTSILNNIRKAKRSGYDVAIPAKVCDSDKMKKLRTMQIGIKDLLDSSFALEKYATNQFKEINQTYKDKIKGILKNYAYPSLLEKGKG